MIGASLVGLAVNCLPPAGDVGLIPDLGRFHVSEQLDQCSTSYIEPVL